MMISNIKALVSDTSCYEKIRELRWPNGVCCPRCDSADVIKRGKDDKQKERQRYECKTCSSRFDDLTGTILEGHHQPLKTWVLCLHFMGLNLSNQQIAAALDLNKDDAQSMTSQLREGLVKKTPVRLSGEVECDEVTIVAGHKGHPGAVLKAGRQGRRRRLKGARADAASWRPKSRRFSE